MLTYLMPNAYIPNMHAVTPDGDFLIISKSTENTHSSHPIGKCSFIELDGILTDLSALAARHNKDYSFTLSKKHLYLFQQIIKNNKDYTIRNSLIQSITSAPTNPKFQIVGAHSDWIALVMLAQAEPNLPRAFSEFLDDLSELLRQNAPFLYT